MGFFDDFQTVATTGLLDMFSVPAIYSPVNSEPVSCYVKIDHNAELGPSGFDAEIVEIGITIEGAFSDIGSPKQGSTFLISGTTYTVKKVLENDRNMVKVAVND